MPKNTKRLNLAHRNFTIKRFMNGKMVYRHVTHKLRRFSDDIQATDFSLPGTTCYIKVYDGEKLGLDGKMARFYNDGLYDNRKALMLAYHAFIET